MRNILLLHILYKTAQDVKPINSQLYIQEYVKSLLNCISCHKTADKGYYGERNIIIPNFGKWKD